MAIFYFELILLTSILLQCGSALRQDEVDALAENLEIVYTVVNNMVYKHDYFQAKIGLRNSGDVIITDKGWQIYFCHLRMFKSTSHDAKFDLSRYGVTVSHVAGCLMKLEPIEKRFPILRRGASHVIYFIAEFDLASRYYLMPNWYLTAPGVEPRIIGSTKGESLSFVADFDRPEQWKRYSDDKFSPFTPFEIFRKNSRLPTASQVSPPFSIVPKPLMFSIKHGSELINLKNYKIKIEGEGASAKFLHEYLSKTYGQKRHSNSMVISIAPGKPENLSEHESSIQVNESYSLIIRAPTSRPAILITAPTDAGAFYAVQTLISLSALDGFVPQCEIVDAPRFQYRGMHLDVARNFVQKETVKRLMDMMALYKLNRLHLHLSDDEAWRLEIPGLPELTTVGGKRCHDLTETRCLLPQMGSGPTSVAPGSGFYTMADYRELLTHAARLRIEVIPEIDMPGHSRAAIKSMQARNITSGDETYLLTEQNDTSEYLSVQLYKDNAINPCLSSTYTFIAKVVDEIVAVHKSVNPIKAFHFGGDEVAKGAWLDSPSCRKWFESHGGVADVVALKLYFVGKVKSIVAQHDVDLAGWEDGLSGKHGPNSALGGRVYSYIWNNVWEWGHANRAYRYANAGYKVVMAQATHLYFDHPQEPDPEERGFYWASRYTDTKKVFGFSPFNLYALADTTRAGHPVTKDMLCGTSGDKCTTLEKPSNIVGMQGHLWTETVRTTEQMDAMIFPRMLALAERAWHRAEWEDIRNTSDRRNKRLIDWSRFSVAVGMKELPRLDKIGVDYYIPRPGAKLVDGKLEANVQFPGLVTEYSINGTGLWSVYTNPLSSPSAVILRTRTRHGNRTSRTVTVSTPSMPLLSTPTSAVSRSTAAEICVIVLSVIHVYSIRRLTCR